MSVSKANVTPEMSPMQLENKINIPLQVGVYAQLDVHKCVTKSENVACCYLESVLRCCCLASTTAPANRYSPESGLDTRRCCVREHLRNSE